jgi:hypothetical protein
MQLSRREFTGHLVAGAALAATAVSVEGCAAPNWINVALADLPTILNIASTVAQIVADALGGGALTPAIAAIIAAATAAINIAIPVIQKLIADYQATPNASILANIKTALLDVQANLSQILDAAHILNPALRATITTAMGLAIGVVTAILSLLPPPAVAGALKAQTTAQTGWAKDPTSAANIDAQFKAFLVAEGYGRYAK